MPDNKDQNHNGNPTVAATRALWWVETLGYAGRAATYLALVVLTVWVGTGSRSQLGAWMLWMLARICCVLCVLHLLLYQAVMPMTLEHRVTALAIGGTAGFLGLCYLTPAFQPFALGALELAMRWVFRPMAHAGHFLFVVPWGRLMIESTPWYISIPTLLLSLAIPVYAFSYDCIWAPMRRLWRLAG